MLALLQRVLWANVKVADTIVGEVAKGLLVFVGVEKGDIQKNADRLLERILGYRIFADAEDKMNLNVQQIKGGVLLVPQFTLAADTQKGMRPSFTPAATPAEGQNLFAYLVQQAQQIYTPIACGQFGANMVVSLANDGPVTFMLQG
jgi:D-tyrosyl-tRNA(Tyr) deacylase